MNCEECHKSAASVHIQEIIGDKRLTLNLCAACASGKGFDAENGLQGINLATLLQDLAKATLAKTATEGTPARAEALRHCPRCGLSEADFRKHGRFGCAACYGVFTELLATLLPEIHRGNTHAGKKPGTLAAVTIAERPPPDLHVLMADLDRAVAAEAYERAAELRDAIRRLTLSRRKARPPRLPRSPAGSAGSGSAGLEPSDGKDARPGKDSE